MRIDRLLRAALVATALSVAVVYGVEALGDLRAQVREAGARGVELLVALGDVAIRDVPKALAIRDVGFFADPHYAGERHWYPFMTPLVAAGVSRALGVPVNEAYFTTGVLLGALWLAALAVLLRSWAGSLGLVLLPAAVLAGLAWPDGGTYPYATSRLPWTLFLLAAGAAFARDGEHGRPLAPVRLFLAAGVAQGVLGIWHGASFVAASVVSAVAVGKLAVRAARTRDGRRARLLRIALWVAPVAACLALLLAPQVLRHGTFRQSDVARLWLLESTFGTGDRPGDVLRLALVPRGRGAAWLVAFAAVLVLARGRRRAAISLAIAWVAAKAAAHLGFVLHSPEHPWLAAVARRVLLAPPHTLDGVAEETFALMKLWTVAAAVGWLWETAPARAARERAIARSPILGRPVMRDGIALAAALVLTVAVALRPPPIAPLYVQRVEAAIPRFAERVRAVLGPDETIVGANGLIRLVPIHVLAVTSPAHGNPYVQDERAAAAGALEDAARRGDWAGAGAILERYRIRYALEDGPLARGCADAVVMRSPQGIPLFHLAAGCGVGAPGRGADAR